MKTINEIRAFTATPEYGKTFWNAMRIKHNAEAEIIDRSPISMRAFKERFAMTDQVGYVGFELLDSRLVRKDAIKVLTVTA